MRDWFLPNCPEPLAQALLFLMIVAVLGLCSIVIGESLPRSLFHYDKFPYRPYPWEKNGAVYDKIHIKKWKDRLPDNSKVLPRLFKKQVRSFHDPAYILRFLQETCEAEAVHWVLMLCSPLFVLLMNPGWGLCMSILYALGNLPFIFIQRYNRPRLARIYERMVHKEVRL